MLLIGATLAACQQSPQRGVIAGELRASEYPSLRLGEDSLTDRQRCFMREFERDSLPGAACMIPCIRDGSGYGIGGGCWHVCYSSKRGVGMPTPDRFEHCPGAGPEPVSPRPVVTCTLAPGKRELRVRFVNAATNAPLRSGMLHPSSRTGPVQADSLGTLSMSITDTLRVEYVGHALGYAYVMDTISVEPNSVCDVLMRLISARGHGF